MANKKSFLQVLGPGILFASTAIGVSHLVQSTRAGAVYGFATLAFVLMANIFKYPFFEFGSRYANATGKSILHGYKNIGKWVLYLYLFITIGSMFTVAAAVTMVCAGLLDHLFQLGIDIEYSALLLISICVALLCWGKFQLLDKLIKLIAIVLLLSTMLAFVMTLWNGPLPQVAGFVPPDLFDNAGLLFLMALMGWMPSAVDLSSWNSIWTVEKIKETGYHPSMRESLTDFNIGYLISSLLAICFMTLGAYLMYGTGELLANNSSTFAGQLVKLFSFHLGSWSYLIIACSAFSVMFSTTITVFDGYARVLSETTVLLGRKVDTTSRKKYYLFLVFIAIGAWMLISLFRSQFRQLIDIATVISFVVAPLIAFMNLKAVTNKEVPLHAQPPKWLKVLAVLGLIFLTSFLLIYGYSRLV